MGTDSVLTPYDPIKLIKRIKLISHKKNQSKIHDVKI